MCILNVNRGYLEAFHQMYVLINNKVIIPLTKCLAVLYTMLKLL